MNIQEKITHFKTRFPSAEVEGRDKSFAARFPTPVALSAATSAASHPIEIARQFVLSEMEAFDITKPEHLRLAQFNLADEYGLNLVRFGLSIDGFNLDYWIIRVTVNTSGELLSFNAKTWLPSEATLECVNSSRTLNRTDAANIIVSDLKDEQIQCSSGCATLSELVREYQNIQAVEVASNLTQDAPHCRHRTKVFYHYDINAETGEIISKKSTRRY